MSEILATISLLGIGYLITNKQAESKEKKETYMNNSLSKIIDAKKIEAQAAQLKNAEDNHIPSLEQPFKPNSSDIRSTTNEVVSMLSGKVLNERQFKTRNDGQVMEPFSGKGVTQNTKDLNIPNRLLEPNGLSDFSCKKMETKPMFAPTKGYTNVNGSPVVSDEAMKDRYFKTNKRQGELPFEQVHVAPGLGQNYGTDGAGGYHQLETQELIKPKNIDQLRSQNNQKSQYNGRVISGKRVTEERGKTGAVVKNLPEGFYKNDPKRYFTSQSSVLKQKNKENFTVKNTNRQISRQFLGGAKVSTDKQKLPQKVREPIKNIYMAKEPTNPTAVGQWKDDNQNYGKKGYKAYPNERDITQKRTNKLNLTKVVKNLISPIQDLMKTTKKENFVGNNRPEGNMNARMPQKMTVYDPNDVTRTTIKETTIDNKHTGQMAGQTKLTVYDPNDVARTTIKETTIDNKHTGHVENFTKKHQVLQHDTGAKTTGRETLDNHDYNMNLSAPRKLQTFNKKNPPKKTTKETTVEKIYSTFAHGGVKKGGYLVESGIVTAPNTSRQFMADNEYTGSGLASVKNHGSYDSSYNARLNINKEQIARGRAPTKESYKVANGGDSVAVSVKKQMSGVAYPKINKGTEFIKTAGEFGVKLSHHKDQLNNDQQTQRIQSEVLEALKENPYAHSVTDVGPELVLNKNKDLEGQLLEKESEQAEIDRLIEEEIAKLG